MTSADLTHTQSETHHVSASRSVDSLFRRMLGELKRRWSLYRTWRALSGLDERTLKDIGAPRPGGAAAAVDARTLLYLDTLR